MSAGGEGSDVWAFIDEYGDTSIVTEKDGVSQFFIVAAVVARASDLSGLRVELDRIRARFFQTGEMKSSKLAGNRDRWARLLAELAPLPFRFYGLAVDKTAIDRSSGLQWKQSFYKHLCGRAYGKLLQAFPDLHVRADEHGRTEFKESFARYIEANHRPDLFARGTFKFVDGKSEVIVQLADLVAGLLARVYDPGKRLAKPVELLRIVGDRALLVDEWPVRFRLRSQAGEIAGGDAVDERIAQYSMQAAEHYVATNEDTLDEDRRARVYVLERLLFERRFGDASTPVATGALLDNLVERGLRGKAETWLRLSVIAPLRDQGVLITSSPGGYKLPDRRSDLVAFVRHAESVCVPMLNRLRSASDAVRLATQGEIDILADAGFKTIARLVDAVGDARALEEQVEP